MPTKKIKEVIEEDSNEDDEPKVIIPEKVQPVQAIKKRTRTMTPEMLEKLKKARELALLAKKKGKEINNELEVAKKETFSNKIDQVETYRKLKDKVEDEVKRNEIVLINKKMDDLYGKINGYLEEKATRRKQKEELRQEKKAKEIVEELPAVLSKKLLEDEIKNYQINYWRKKHFGID